MAKTDDAPSPAIGNTARRLDILRLLQMPATARPISAASARHVDSAQMVAKGGPSEPSCLLERIGSRAADHANHAAPRYRPCFV
jgi:hypothetical protein